MYSNTIIIVDLISIIANIYKQQLIIIIIFSAYVKELSLLRKKNLAKNKCIII